MDNLIKQRLVGALILLALAVVFWPIIFVSKTPDSASLEVLVPETPPVNLAPLPEPDIAGLRRGKLAEAQKQPVLDVSLPEPDPNEIAPVELRPQESVLPEQALSEARETLSSPAMDSDGLPIAFSLQVATMGNRSGAEALRDELVNAGYKGYLKRLRRDDKLLYRVLVGPKFSREDLSAIKTAVDSRWRVESMIIRYLP